MRGEKVHTILVIVAAFFSTDLQRSLMQRATWVNMIRQSDSTTSVAQKVVLTITGQARCNQWEALANERNSERNGILSLPGKHPMAASLGDSPFASLIGATISLILSPKPVGQI